MDNFKEDNKLLELGTREENICMQGLFFNFK